ncbi:5-formyltetrahydrofolate cyclo-ligase [Penicillium concentricum]|uniref:5-formyltetrahydrofolate cyclo-ligase n=1 Tax=Penicillium concentricum TaxID=293559 RepID=A0A9W9S8Q3_9EURO|nr:5-formyltetrahydrofolate cyclo-ligase [Penicillium concentricum]KAJ5373667.1 5-formyltetrahydrofolate cyclo-ligase [Penicillium concentricum]
MAFQTAKRELRKRMSSTLQSLSAASISQQSSTATAKFLSLPEYQNAKSIAVYLSMPSGELSTTGIVRDALQRGKNVYIPYIHTQDKTSIMDMFALKSMSEFESLQPDKWGIPSLLTTQIEGRPNGLTQGLDLIVMPGVAFDHGFRRLGHGKGYYDHFLTRYSKLTRKMPFLVALSLQDQLLSEDIPVVEHDWLIDAIVVGDGQYLDRRV